MFFTQKITYVTLYTPRFIQTVSRRPEFSYVFLPSVKIMSSSLIG